VLLKAAIAMELRAHCAYNETRERFLGLEVIAGEFSFASLEKALARLALKPSEGFWLKPFYGLPTTGPFNPFDLILLDDNCTVLEIVESFAMSLTGSSIQRATSALVLPVDTICSSETQIGDQLVLCEAEEMEWRLKWLACARDDSRVLQGAVLLREQPLWSGGLELMEREDRNEDESCGLIEAYEMSLIEPGMSAVSPPINNPARWWSPDPLTAPQKPWPGPAVYLWNCPIPKPHSFRDTRATKLHGVLTEERWYPGTLVLMMLQRTDAWVETAERSISVVSRAVRRAKDRVDLQFVLDDEQNSRIGRNPEKDGTGNDEFTQFLQKLLKVKV
jgi:hypothetical protein